MIIRFAPPPKWEAIKEKFNLTEAEKIWYTHGDCIYSPSGTLPPDDVICHEQIHAEQQMHSEDVGNIWWENFLYDPVFRMEQEAEAYGAQYEFLCRRYKDRNQRNIFLHQMASYLSGPKYGNPCTYAEARKLIKDFSEIKTSKLSTSQLADNTNLE